MAAPAITGTPTANSGTGSVTVTLDAGLSFIAVCTEAQNLPIGLATLINDAGNSWTAIVGTKGGAGVSVAGASLCLYVFTKVTTAAETITTGDSGVFQAYSAFTVTGYDTGTNTEALASGSGTADAGGVISVPSLTTAGADRLVVGFVAPRADSTNSASAGWTNAGLSGVTALGTVQTAAGSGGGAHGFYGTKAAAGATGATTNDYTNAIYNSAAFGYATFAIRPVSAAVITGASVMAAAGSASASGTRKTFGASTLAGAGSSSASGVRKTFGAATLSGTGSSSAAGVRKTFGASVLSASGSLAAAGVRSAIGAATLSSAVSMAAAGARKTFGAATLAAQALFIASSPEESDDWPQHDGDTWAAHNDSGWPSHSGDSWES